MILGPKGIKQAKCDYIMVVDFMDGSGSRNHGYRTIIWNCTQHTMKD